MSQHLEIERKYLVKSFPRGWKHCPHSKIAQGYLACGEKSLSIRLRKKDAKRLLTIKAGQGRRRVEEEIAMTRENFDALWPLTSGARVTKTRYRIPSNREVIDLDVYHGVLRGLAVAEIEFESERNSRRFRPPPWLGREMTSEREYANESLARRRIGPG